MFSFWGRFFLYLVLALVFLVVSVYGFWVFWYHEKGAPWVDALLWFRNSKLSFFLLYSFALGFWVFALGVFASAVFFLREMGEFSRYENLRERSEELERKVSTLTQKERELRGRVGALQREKENLSASVSDLRETAQVLKREVLNLGEKRKSLDKLIREAVERGYREGYERAYGKIIGELRSMRAQSSQLSCSYYRVGNFIELN